ncbi:hypothetical protein [Hafnia alvei]|uniref:hypothetical protein n=1 Tax=Hafnia alvei TaxID=569 RepID=UPI00214B2D75|nr:hypothetical protein [Hafnia alvei]
MFGAKYCGDSDLSGDGVLGTNAEYLFSLDSALEQHRMPDHNINTAGALRASNSANKVTVIIDVYFLIVS